MISRQLMSPLAFIKWSSGRMMYGAAGRNAFKSAQTRGASQNEGKLASWHFRHSVFSWVLVWMLIKTGCCCILTDCIISCWLGRGQMHSAACPSLCSHVPVTLSCACTLDFSFLCPRCTYILCDTYLGGLSPLAEQHSSLRGKTGDTVSFYNVSLCAANFDR